MLLDNALINRQLTRNAANQLVAINNGASYTYDGHGLRVKKNTGNGSIYTLYDASGKLRYREDTGFNIRSEYFYVGNDLIARRDSEPSQSAGAASPENFAATAYSGTAAGFTWTQTVDSNLGTAVSYDIYKNGALLENTNNQNSLWLDSGLSSGVIYQFEIVAVYTSGDKSAKSDTISLLMQNGSTSY